MDDEGLAEVYTDPIPKDEEEAAVEAAENCPVGVITVEQYIILGIYYVIGPTFLFHKEGSVAILTHVLQQTLLFIYLLLPY